MPAYLFLFHAASNAGSELFISTNDKPDSKTMISGVDGGFPSEQYEYDRYESKLCLIASTNLVVQLYLPVSLMSISSLITKQGWGLTSS